MQTMTGYIVEFTSGDAGSGTLGYYSLYASVCCSSCSRCCSTSRALDIPPLPGGVLTCRTSVPTSPAGGSSADPHQPARSPAVPPCPRSWCFVVLGRMLFRIVQQSVGWLDLRFLTGKLSINPDKAGIYGVIMGSVLLMAVVVPVTVTLGVATAI
jgi:hypothetical protein